MGMTLQLRSNKKPVFAVGGVKSFIVCLAIGIFLSLFFSFYTAYVSVEADVRRASDVIAETVEEIFSQVTQLSFRVGNNIGTLETFDVDHVIKFIGHDKNDAFEIKNAFPWLSLSWISVDHKLIYDWRYGRCMPPIDFPDKLSFRDLDREPWKMMTFRPSVSLMSGLREIPGAIAITDNKSGELRGYLYVGINLAELGNRVKNSLKRLESIRYVVLDDSLRVILQSIHSSMDPDTSFFRDNLDQISMLSSLEGALEKTADGNSLEYSYFKKMPKNHLVILTGYDFYDFAISTLKKDLLPTYLFIFLSFIAFFIFRSSVKRFLAQIQHSDTLRKKFLQAVSLEMKQPLQHIVIASEFLKRSYSGEIDLGVDDQREALFVKQIYEAALSLDRLAPNTNTPHKIDLNELVHECILIQLQTALFKDIRIYKNFSRNLPVYVGDPLRVKQILVGILAISFEYCNERSRVLVETSVKIENKEPFLIVSVTDNGINVDENDVRRMSELFATDTPKAFFDPVSSDFVMLEKLVATENAHLYWEAFSSSRNGKRIVLSLPLIEVKENTSEELEAGNFQEPPSSLQSSGVVANLIPFRRK